MIEVRLHGSLAQEFGRVWHLDITTPAEAVRAIECARRGFKDAILKLGNAGFVFRVRSKTHDYNNDDVGTTLGNTDRIDIIPVVRGAAAGVRFVIGAVLVAASIYFGGPLAGAAQMAAFNVGVGLMLGSVIEWLSPKPKKPDTAEGMQSWTFSGPTNTTDQGVPVPIIYGEVLTGSIVVSAGVTVSESSNGYTTRSVSIGGNLDLASTFDTAGIHTQVLTVTASVSGGGYPVGYQWSHSGFPNAVAARWTQMGAVGKLELDYNVQPGSATLDIGSVSVSVPVHRSRAGYYDDYDDTGGLQTLTDQVQVSVYNRVQQ